MPTPQNTKSYIPAVDGLSCLPQKMEKEKNSTVDGRFESQIYKKRKSSPPAGFKKVVSNEL